MRKKSKEKERGRLMTYRETARGRAKGKQRDIEERAE